MGPQLNKESPPNPAYLYCKIDGKWEFVKQPVDYVGKLSYIETWNDKNTNMKYQFCRVVYREESAAQMVQDCSNGEHQSSLEKLMAMMIGPDMYCVYSQDSMRLTNTVWQPQHLPETLEITHVTSSTCLVVGDITMSGIRESVSALSGMDLEVIRRSSKADQMWHVIKNELPVNSLLPIDSLLPVNNELLNDTPTS